MFGENGIYGAIVRTMNERMSERENGAVVRGMMRQASVVKSARHYNLLRGKFEARLHGLSEELRDSAIREFRRVALEASKSW